VFGLGKKAKEQAKNAKTVKLPTKKSQKAAQKSKSQARERRLGDYGRS